MIGALILPLVVVFASASALPEERLDSGYCLAIPVSEGFDLLPCVPAACVPTFCESGVVREDGSFICDDDGELFPDGHWSVDDWQEDDQPGDSVHYTVEY